MEKEQTEKVFIALDNMSALSAWIPNSLRRTAKDAISIKADSAICAADIPSSAFLAAIYQLLDLAFKVSATPCPAGSAPYIALFPVDSFAIDFENSLCALAALLDAIKAPLLMFETDGM